ncbi:MAG: histidine ammonia-lyase [Bacteroidales bacterium]|jgi:histidine ammonia-lyase|nr:histidine ammonia-lyase [Bacteroidales bacterium]
MEKYKILSEPLTLKTIHRLITDQSQLELSQEAVGNIQECRDYLDKKIQTQKEPIYGVTTGFGSLCDTSVDEKKLGKLQENLMMSHACGTGETVPHEIIRLMLLLKIQSLSYGHSGVQLETVQGLIDLYNHHYYPVVYQQGSLGASGDLAPLAHLCLPLIGLGEVFYDGTCYTGKEIQTKLNLKPLKLKSKEGLALLNGTQFMSAYGVWLLMQSKKIITIADLIGSMSLDAFNGRTEPFIEEVHAIRPHAGQSISAFNIRRFLENSEIACQKKRHVQDPYSFRCMPQVHGATRDTIDYVTKVFETEINSVTDNPTVFPKEDMIVSAGNFHGQPLALALDFLSIAMAELGNISERRIYQLIDGKRDLPPFLVAQPGLNSGFMIPQYTAASIVNQNKTLTMPCSSDSIISSQGQEDHVSMGANAATKCYRIIENVEKILAIELFNAAQAMEFRRPLKSSSVIESIIEDYRREVDFIHTDTVMYDKIKKSVEFIHDLENGFEISSVWQV